MTAGTRAFRTLDCARKVRIHYFLPCVLSNELLMSLPHTELQVQAFSKFTPGAKDHFLLENGPAWRAGGVLGENRLVVTFGKFGSEGDECGVEQFTAALDAIGLGPIVEQSAKKAG